MTSQIYSSPFTKALKRVKALSVTGCAASVVSAPVLMQLASQSSLPTAACTVAIGAVLATGIGSTSFLNWFMKPYVTRMKVEGDLDLKELQEINVEKKNQIQLEMYKFDLLGREKPVKCRIGDLKAAETWRPMVMWENKKTGDFFYVHPEIVGESQEGRQFMSYLDRSK